VLVAARLSVAAALIGIVALVGLLARRPWSPNSSVPAPAAAENGPRVWPPPSDPGLGSPGDLGRAFARDVLHWDAAEVDVTSEAQSGPAVVVVEDHDSPNRVVVFAQEFDNGWAVFGVGGDRDGPLLGNGALLDGGRYGSGAVLFSIAEERADGATIFVVTDQQVDEVAVSADDLATDRVPLPGVAVDDVDAILVVYFDIAGRAIDLVGGTF
jgi:hypothetical protein